MVQLGYTLQHSSLSWHVTHFSQSSLQFAPTTKNNLSAPSITVKAKSQPSASCLFLHVQAVEDAVGRHLPELLQCHGTADELVSHAWGEETSTLLKKAGMATSFHSFPGLNHQLCRPELELLRAWILKKLPSESISIAKS